MAPTGGALSKMYKDFDKAGFKSGGEFFVAFSEAKALGVPVLLADQAVSVRRPVSVSLSSASRRTGGT